jgi:DNA-directed RNA polymerase subunit H (RpoH/RPB5)
MSTTSNRIVSIYKSRKTILELLDYQDYDTTEYAGFSINEIDAMFTNSQLDMLVTKKTNQRKAYIKFSLNNKQIRPVELDNIIEDLFMIDNVLTKNDVLIVIIEVEPNDSIINRLKYLYDHDGIFVVVHNIKRLQFNILNHKLVPDCAVLDEEAVEALKKKVNIKSTMQLPEISRFDPQALAMCLRPGDVCQFIRDSATALTYNYYRICI